MKYPILALLLVSFISVNAQTTAKKVAIKNVSEVSVRSGIDLYIKQGNTESLELQGSSELLKDVQIDLIDGELVIRYRDNFRWTRIFKNQYVKAYLTVRSISSLSASGGSDVFSQSVLNVPNLKLSASGGADLELNISTKNLTLQVSGGSDADLRGKAENFTASASGGSDINALELATVNAKVSASGGSDAEINVSRALDASANGGSDVRYKGDPAVKKSSPNSSSVKRL